MTITDRPVLEFGAIAGAVGFALQIVMEHLHPHHEQPNNTVAAFSEYSHATGWTAVHVGQFFGALLIVFSLLALSRLLARQSGLAGALATGGAAALVVVAAVFAVQMAVDGVALKHAVDSWAAATGPAKTSALQVAEGVRWLEKGLSTFYHFMNGTALLGLGLSFVVGRTYRSWPGWVAIVAGIAFMAGGASTAETGFSMQSATILQPALILLLVSLVSAYVSVRRSDVDSMFREDSPSSQASAHPRPSAAPTPARHKTPAA
jgi:hypothetical protein